MSKKYPDWYELPKKRWQETTIETYGTWNVSMTERTVGTRKCRSYRDSQRQKVYDAENLAKFQYTLVDRDKLRRFESVDEIRLYVDKVIQSRWIRKRFGEIRIPNYVTSRGSSAYCSVIRSTLNFPQYYAWNEVIALHEIAHWIHPTGYGTAHGRFFARVFLEMTGHFVGAEFRELLKDAYRCYNVKYRPFPNYSEETLKKKQELGQRLAERRKTC